MNPEVIDLIVNGGQVLVVLVLLGLGALVSRESLKQVVAFVLTIYGYIRALVDSKNDLIIRLIVRYLGITADEAVKYADVLLDTVEAKLKEIQAGDAPNS